LIEKTADPDPSNSWLLAVPPSTLNDTFPVGVPAGDVTVTVADPFALYVIVLALTVVVVGARLMRDTVS
jgi:hypothetical protein